MLARKSGRGTIFDNAVAERFFVTMEFDLIIQSDWSTREDALRVIFRYIETWYNQRRWHSILFYVNPADHEAQHQMGT